MPAPDPAADLRPLQLVWAALIAGVIVLAGVLGGLSVAGRGAGVEPAAVLFYANAAVNLAAVIGAFWVQRRLMDRLATTGTRAEAVAAIRTDSLLSAALMEGSALFAAVAAFVSGQAVNLLFVLPFFGFAAVFFPTAGRLALLLRMAGRG